MSRAARPPVILCADDYALTEGVSRGIEALAGARRLSATSAMVTTPHWTGLGARARALRGGIAVGLHLNLTLGRPLGAMPRLAPDGRLPTIGAAIRASLAGRIEPDEIEAETARQVSRFIDIVGQPPDFVDGHQHVHVLPRIRDGVLGALDRAFPASKPLLRDPADTLSRILGRGASVPKALVLAALAVGFGARARAAGFAVNRGFSGVSAFDRGVPYAQELARFLSHPGPLHLVMCHPGHPDQELAELDPVVEHRQDELEALAAYPELPALIWHPRRDAAGRLQWPVEAGQP